jgi:hypothetical protein
LLYLFLYFPPFLCLITIFICNCHCEVSKTITITEGLQSVVFFHAAVFSSLTEKVEFCNTI